jgi:hypothetical protein
MGEGGGGTSAFKQLDFQVPFEMHKWIHCKYNDKYVCATAVPRVSKPDVSQQSNVDAINVVVSIRRMCLSYISHIMIENNVRRDDCYMGILLSYPIYLTDNAISLWIGEHVWYINVQQLHGNNNFIMKDGPVRPDGTCSK